MPEVRVCLEELGLGQYAEAFEAEKIEVGDLGDLVEADPQVRYEIDPASL